MIWNIFKRGDSQNDMWSSMSSISVMLTKFHAAGVTVASRRQSGIIFSPDDSNPFLANLSSNLDDILYYGPGATKTAVRLKDDEYGMRWVVLNDGDFDDLLSSTYTVANAIRHNGGDDNLLAAAFHMDMSSSLLGNVASTDSLVAEAYLIFRFDRNRYYPFVLDEDSNGERDVAMEVGMASAMRSHGLNIDGERRHWLGLWGIPF